MTTHPGQNHEPEEHPMAAETQTETGIKNADEIIKLGRAYGLTVTVETTGREILTSYVVRFAIPVPVAYAGTELGRTIAGDTVALLWTKAKKKGARGCLVDATVWSVVSHRKVRTLREVTAAVERLGHDSNKYARDAAPLPEDVIDALHAVFVDGRQVHPGIPAAHVRTIVKNQRFRGWTFHQDAENAICIEDRRYVPVIVTGPTPDDVVDAPHAVYDSHNDRHKDIPAADVRHMIARRHDAGQSSHQSDNGTITAAGIRFVPQSAGAPAAEERMHVRIVNDGPSVLIPTREALAEINAAMMQPLVKRTVKRMSVSKSTAHIVYRDGRTVYLRPATPGDTFPTPQRPTDAELTGPIDAELSAYYAETFAAIADNTAIPVRADMVRPGMDVIAAHLGENRTIGTITAYAGPGAPWVRVSWTTRNHNDSVMGDRGTYPPDMHLMITRESLDAVFGPTPAATVAAERPALEVLAADPIPAGASVLKGMPGREITHEELRTAGDVLPHTDYVVQLRNSGAWILPNHDDQADMTRGHVATALRLAFHRSQGPARATLDSDGTIYVSNGYQAARYIPAARIADYSADFCPGCHTPYATNGDGPCTGGRSVPAREARTENVQEPAIPASFHAAREPRTQDPELTRT
ncbi:hypothetical protein [Streptomyces sp. NPDC001948]